MIETIGAILVGAFAITFGVMSIGPLMLHSDEQ